MQHFLVVEQTCDNGGAVGGFLCRFWPSTSFQIRSCAQTADKPLEHTTPNHAAGTRLQPYYNFKSSNPVPQSQAVSHASQQLAKSHSSPPLGKVPAESAPVHGAAGTSPALRVSCNKQPNAKGGSSQYRNKHNIVTTSSCLAIGAPTTFSHVKGTNDSIQDLTCFRRIMPIWVIPIPSALCCSTIQHLLFFDIAESGSKPLFHTTMRSKLLLLGQITRQLRLLQSSSPNA